MKNIKNIIAVVWTELTRKLNAFEVTEYEAWVSGRMTLAFLFAALAFSAPARAWEVEGNPDRLPSIGVHASQGHLSGTYSDIVDPTASSPKIVIGSEKVNDSAVGFDFRFPLLDALTFTFSYDRLTQDRVHEGSGLQTFTSGLRGDRVDFGFRYYMNGK